MSSLAWLDSAFVGKDAKFAAAFLSGAGLAEVITQKFIHTALTPGVANFLQNIVLPHAETFAWLIAIGDLAIGLSLSLGLFTRLGGALAIARAITNILIAGGPRPDRIQCDADGCWVHMYSDWRGEMLWYRRFSPCALADC